jgi:hypothetical protein
MERPQHRRVRSLQQRSRFAIHLHIYRLAGGVATVDIYV